MAIDPASRSRRALLRRLGAGPAEARELLAYNASRFAPAPAAALPLADEPCVAAWEEYAAEAEKRGAAPVLRERLVQLRFPVEEGISRSDAYLASTRRGDAAPEGPGVALRDPAGIRIFLHPTPAGRLPVIAARHRDDFVTLLRALLRRNEPVPVPASMGACAVGGFVNWDRVARLRAAFERGEGPLAGAADWSAAMAALGGRKELYHDRFVLLAANPYSGVSAAEVGMEDEAWLGASFTLRLEHESTHYLTRRVLGSMRNALLDELLADYAGIVAAAGRFRADWLLRFMGMEEPGAYRAGGRLENYRGDPPLSPAAFTVLQRLVVRAAETLARVDAELGPGDRTPLGRARVVLALARFTVEDLARRDAAGRVLATLRSREA